MSTNLDQVQTLYVYCCTGTDIGQKESTVVGTYPSAFHTQTLTEGNGLLQHWEADMQHIDVIYLKSEGGLSIKHSSVNIPVNNFKGSMYMVAYKG